jgi:hypothetical protein
MTSKHTRAYVLFVSVSLTFISFPLLCGLLSSETPFMSSETVFVSGRSAASIRAKAAAILSAKNGAVHLRPPNLYRTTIRRAAPSYRYAAHPG